MMDSPYRILKQFDNQSVKMVEVITDYQLIMDTNIGKESKSHYELISDIEKKIYPSLTEMELAERENENAYIFLTDLGAIISFPENGRISLPQISFILDFMKEISKYNREVPERKKIPMDINGYGRIGSLYDINELDEKVAKEWSRHLRSLRIFEKEKIIGKKYSQKQDHIHRI